MAKMFPRSRHHHHQGWIWEQEGEQQPRLVVCTFPSLLCPREHKTAMQRVPWQLVPPPMASLQKPV